MALPVITSEAANVPEVSTNASVTVECEITVPVAVPPAFVIVSPAIKILEP